MLVIRFFTLFFLALMMSSCEKPTTKITKLNNIELRTKWRECAYIQTPSNTKKKMCNHYEIECEKRKNDGNLACY
jgi:hypothetical protein